MPQCSVPGCTEMGAKYMHFTRWRGLFFFPTRAHSFFSTPLAVGEWSMTDIHLHETNPKQLTQWWVPIRRELTVPYHGGATWGDFSAGTSLVTDARKWESWAWGCRALCVIHSRMRSSMANHAIHWSVHMWVLLTSLLNNQLPRQQFVAGSAELWLSSNYIQYGTRNIVCEEGGCKHTGKSTGYCFLAVWSCKDSSLITRLIMLVLSLTNLCPMLPRSFRSPSVKQSLQDRTDIWRNVTI